MSEELSGEFEKLIIEQEGDPKNNLIEYGWQCTVAPEISVTEMIPSLTAFFEQ